jgi:hypothetical protein
MDVRWILVAKRPGRNRKWPSLYDPARGWDATGSNLAAVLLLSSLLLLLTSSGDGSGSGSDSDSDFEGLTVTGQERRGGLARTGRPR